MVRFLVLILLSVVVEGCKSPGSPAAETAPPGALVRVDFEASWTGSMRWRLTVFADGTFAAEGRSLRRVRRRLPEAELAALRKTIDEVRQRRGRRSWPNGVDDADRLFVVLPEDDRLAFAIDLPLVANCNDFDLTAVWEILRYSVERIAPRAMCNGVPCSELWSLMDNCYEW